MDIKQEKEILIHPYAMFMYAIKSPLTRKKYEGRLAKFFNFVGMAGETLEGRCAAFEQKSRADPKWAASMIIEFLQSLKQRVHSEFSLILLPCHILNAINLQVYKVPKHQLVIGKLSEYHLSRGHFVFFFSFLVASIIQMHCNAEHTNSSYMLERPKLYLIRPEYRDYAHI